MSTRPRATVVLATHARADFLDDCITTVLAALGADDELLVIECCTDAGNELRSTQEPEPRVRRVVDGHAAKCVKLNAAIRRARGEVILVTDDDCRVPATWVESMLRPFENDAVGIVFGPVTGLSSLSGAPPPAVPPGPAPPELWNYAHGASMAVRLDALVGVGGFDERLGAGARLRGGEEADLALRLGAAGWTAAIADVDAVQHLPWRDDSQTVANVIGYQRGTGAYLGAALRRGTAHAIKPLVLRLAHERTAWRDTRASGAVPAARATGALVAGLGRGLLLAPRRFLDPGAAPPLRFRGRPEVVWVTDEAPDRSLGGGSIRQFQLLDRLADRADITLVLLGRLSDHALRDRLRSVCEVAPPRQRASRTIVRRLRDLTQTIFARQPAPVIDARRARRALRDVVTRTARDADVVVVHHLHLAPLLPRAPSTRWLLHLFDLESGRVRHELAREQTRRVRWRLRAQAAKGARCEQAAVVAYDGVVAASEHDADVLRRAGGPRAARVAVVPNGVDASAFEPTPLPAAWTVLLPGTLDYRPNVLGAHWFCTQVMPHLRDAVPGVRFAIVGRRPVAAVRELERCPGVEVHADAPSMATWFQWARVVVVPLHIGTGTRLKALEAMAAGRPVVGTAIGLQGLGLVDRRDARIVDEPRPMADAIAELLTSDVVATRIANAGRQRAEACFGWDRASDVLADLFVGASAPSPQRAANLARATRREVADVQGGR